MSLCPTLPANPEVSSLGRKIQFPITTLFQELLTLGYLSISFPPTKFHVKALPGDRAPHGGPGFSPSRLPGDIWQNLRKTEASWGIGICLE